ncbi:MAG: hypothetical protein EXR22_03410 [Flavobacteriaceae bacterium]|nr:hypothetical protein [Flavobacteriaceae bacterium]PHX84230.1 MAG: hypothetical protein CK537_01535 [Flavobacteriales bacterium]
MSIDLNSALSGLSLSLQSEVASDAQLRELESLLLLAHQSKLRAALQSIQSEAEVQFAAAHAALAKAQEEAQATAKAEFAQAQADAEAALAAAVALRVEALAQEPASQESASQESASQEPASQEPSMMEAVLEPVADSVQESPYELEQESATLSMQTQPEPQTPSAPAASEQPRGPQRSVNSSYASLNAGLNDRLAFVKSLFGGDDHDYQRVVAYLSTLESKSECETFIVEALQPEYDWSACPDVAERFLKLVYARFD